MTGVGARGWQVFAPDPRTRAWADAARGAADRALADPANAGWFRHGCTWFAGVNVLGNADDGSVGGVPLAGPALDVVREAGLWPAAWDRAQVSVVFPGYPRRDPGETEAAHRYRRTRDAAHLDGLLPVGPDRRRMLRETHAFILGLPLSHADASAAPFTVWENSHLILGRALSDALLRHPPDAWGDIDVTEVYHAARRRAFEACPRRILHAEPGGAYLVHRHALHGVAPWDEGARADPAGRMIAYFRPALAPDRWLGP